MFNQILFTLIMMIAFCTTCKGRIHHLEQTLPRNLAENPTGKFVVLDYNSPDHMGRYLRANHHADIIAGRLTVYSMLSGEDGNLVPFHMAHAKNMAHRCGCLEGGDVLVNLDADAYAGAGFDDFLEEVFSNKSHCVFMQALWNRWVEKEDGTKEWLCQEPSGEFGPPVPKGSNGRMAYTKKAFLLAGGYDEKYATWSPDDKDFNIRLRRLGYTPRLLERRFQDTILHNNKVRFKDYPHAASLMEEGDQFKMTVHDSTDTIANWGKIGCGTVYRNFNFDVPIDLKPVPTRIFGIGLHKTATQSLHAALVMLGYQSAHWKSAHWAKAIWDEMHQAGKSLTLERSYALTDLPIGMLYEQLDKAYPGSKFILTVRDSAKWIESVRRHWDPNFNKFRQQWDHDPFSHQMHKLLYGRRDFDCLTMLDRYSRHNLDVRTYFASRPDDLLVHNVDEGHGWPELCRFLGKPEPSDTPYPQVST